MSSDGIKFILPLEGGNAAITLSPSASSGDKTGDPSLDIMVNFPGVFPENEGNKALRTRLSAEVMGTLRDMGDELGFKVNNRSDRPSLTMPAGEAITALQATPTSEALQHSDKEDRLLDLGVTQAHGVAEAIAARISKRVEALDVPVSRTVAQELEGMKIAEKSPGFAKASGGAGSDRGRYILLNIMDDAQAQAAAELRALFAKRGIAADIDVQQTEGSRGAFLVVRTQGIGENPKLEILRKDIKTLVGTGTFEGLSHGRHADAGDLPG